MKTLEIPRDGLSGLKQNWGSDALAGFLVFLLALPLSLGIAKASEFPPAMGVLTAMVGGLLVSLFAGSRLTIKGPAAGLITVCSGAVIEMGGGAEGWHLACGVIVVTAIIQIIFGFLKFGSLSDFFPLSAVHGMLAAIGIIIIGKEVPILLGATGLAKGLGPIGLYIHIPDFVSNANPRIALIGVLSLIIIFGMPALGGYFKKIPAPMVVLLVMIPLGRYLDIKTSVPGSLVNIGDFWSNVGFNADFGGIGTFVFWKYVFMFLFVNSLESLLTVKAIDGLDPWRRKSNYNKDLTALGLGNGVSGLLGGLPMISEVVRSGANISFGGRTVWSNFFHGLFLFLAMLLMIPAIEMIPNAALAAMLIFAGYRLSSPKSFVDTYKIGREQLAIFLVTIFVTMAKDLMLGILAGIIVKLVFHIVNGASIRNLFVAKFDIAETQKGFLMVIRGAAIFSNILGFKKAWSRFPNGKLVTLDFSYAKLVDHSFMEQLHQFEEDYKSHGGTVTIIALDNLNRFSAHPLAARKLAEKPGHLNAEPSRRQVHLKDFADARQYSFNPEKLRNPNKFKGFPIQRGNSILYEENMMSKTSSITTIDISDLTLTEGARHAKSDTQITVIRVIMSRLAVAIPDFSLEPEGFGTKFYGYLMGQDVDFEEYPSFSNRYFLRGENESDVRQFFNHNLIRFLEKHDDMHIESHNNILLLYLKHDLLEPLEIEQVENFVNDLVNLMEQERTIQVH